MKKKKLQFSKIIVLIILIISLIDIQIPFILAFIGREEIAESLAITIVTEIIGVFAVYSVKAFLETKEAEKNKLERDKMDDGLEFIDISDVIKKEEKKHEG